MERVRAALRSATGGGAGVDRDGDRDGLGGGGAGLAGGLNSSHSSGAGAGAYPPLAPPPAPPPLFAAGRAAAAAYTRAAPRPSLLAGGAGGRSSFATGVERFGVQSKGLAYFRDPFHSMVSLPTGRFYAMFFAVYLALYVLFALLYLSFSDRCIKGLEGRFSHALWIASRTAATLGYSDLLMPLPTCPWVNLLVMLQVITCSLINFIMLGLVFARFSAPGKRARSIRFARYAVVRRWRGGSAPASGAQSALSVASDAAAGLDAQQQQQQQGQQHSHQQHQNQQQQQNQQNHQNAHHRQHHHPHHHPQHEIWWAVEVRVANLRKHTLLAPDVRMFVASLDSVDPGRFALDQLEVEAPQRQLLALSLGLAATVTHVVRPTSPLYNLSLAEMEARLFELLVFVDGTDAMTSRQMQARHSYSLGEDGVLAGRAHAGMHLGLRRGGKLGLDFARFDETVPEEEGGGGGGGGGAVASGVELRHLTFRRLAEAERRAAAARGGGGAAGAAAEAAARASASGAGLAPKPPPPPPVPAAFVAVEMARAGASPHYSGSSGGGGARPSGGAGAGAGAGAPAAPPAPPPPTAAPAAVHNPFAPRPPLPPSSGGGGGGARSAAAPSFSNVHL